MLMVDKAMSDIESDNELCKERCINFFQTWCRKIKDKRFYRNVKNWRKIFLWRRFGQTCLWILFAELCRTGNQRKRWILFLLVLSNSIVFKDGLLPIICSCILIVPRLTVTSGFICGVRHQRFSRWKIRMKLIEISIPEMKIQRV